MQEKEQEAGQEPASMQPVSKTKICRNCGEKIDIRRYILYLLRKPNAVPAPEQAAVTEDVFAEPAAAPAAENEPVWSLEQEDDTVYVPSWSSFEPISAAEPAPAQEAVFEETAEAAAETVPSQETVFEEPAPQPASAPFDVTEETEPPQSPYLYRKRLQKRLLRR